MVETNAERSWARVESELGVLIDILSRLSVKSIRSVKTVSRLWHGSISNKHFAKKHLSRSRENPSYIVCPSMDTTMELHLLKQGSFRFQHLTTVDPSRRSVEHYMYMVSSFNGLVCCINRRPVEHEDQYHDLQVWICNPSTEETLLLPQGKPSFGTEPCIGVAYGQDIDEYKVFRIFCVGEKNPEEKVFHRFNCRENVFYGETRDAFLHECEVYSSSTGAWRNIGPVPHIPMPFFLSPHRSTHVCARGKIYWLVSLDDILVKSSLWM